MSLQDWRALYQFQSRHRGPLRGFIRSFMPHFQRKFSRALLNRFAPSGPGLELGSGEQTIAPLSRTILSDSYQTHAGANSLAREFFPAENIPYSDAHFQFLLSEHVLEHLPNPIIALREFRRVLKRDGILFLFLPHPERTFDRYRAVTSLEHLYEDFKRQTSSLGPSEALHWKEWNEKVLEKNLAPHYRNFTREESLKNNIIHRHVFSPVILATLLVQEGWTILERIDCVPDRSDSFVIICK